MCVKCKKLDYNYLLIFIIVIPWMWGNYSDHMDPITNRCTFFLLLIMFYKKEKKILILEQIKFSYAILFKNYYIYLKCRRQFHREIYFLTFALYDNIHFTTSIKYRSIVLIRFSKDLILNVINFIHFVWPK